VFLSDIPRVGIASKGVVTVIESAGITITLTMGTDSSRVAPDKFFATWNLSTAQGTIVGDASGEALLVAGIWQFRGKSRVLGGTLAGVAGIGGFSAELDTNLAGMGDDSISWMFDAVPGR
jgi:hypothetical protein